MADRKGLVGNNQSVVKVYRIVASEEKRKRVVLYTFVHVITLSSNVSQQR